MIPSLLAERASLAVCNLETIGRTSGLLRTIEIWFAAAPADEEIYLLSGGGEAAHWVRNLQREPRVRLHLGDLTLTGLATVITGGETETMARHALAAKYQGWREGQALSRWAATALPVVIRIDELLTEDDSR